MLHSGWTRLRQGINWINTSTVCGLLIARLGRCSIERHERGTWLATDYGLNFPDAAAFTVGNVIITTWDRKAIVHRPALLRHEDRHCTQFAWCLGPAMLPLYAAAMGISWILTGSHAALNPFERLASLEDGDYHKAPLRFRVGGFRVGRSRVGG